jgi:hypothetical protein
MRIALQDLKLTRFDVEVRVGAYTFQPSSISAVTRACSGWPASTRAGSGIIDERPGVCAYAVLTTARKTAALVSALRGITGLY